MNRTNKAATLVKILDTFVNSGDSLTVETSPIRVYGITVGSDSTNDLKTIEFQDNDSNTIVFVTSNDNSNASINSINLNYTLNIPFIASNGLKAVVTGTDVTDASLSILYENIGT